jgi:hypothetical protein
VEKTSSEGIKVVSTHPTTTKVIHVGAYCALYEMACRRPHQGWCIEHPANGEAWRSFDILPPDFMADSRNVRLGLIADGFNPFGNMSTSQSTWPVLLVPYNLPPWMCMKQTSFILSLVIPGPSSPGMDIDVYLQPLIDELLELWNVGERTLDTSKMENLLCELS